MISIAICDDNELMSRQVETEVKRLLDEKRVMYTEEVFNDSSFLLYEIQDGAHYDLLLLDIEMPELDGISLMNKVREYLPDCLAIFITSHEKYVYESFKVQPFRFIPKTMMKEQLPSAILDAVVWIEKTVQCFYSAENQQGMEKIPIGRITHIWHEKKYAYIEQTDGKSTKVRKTLKQIYDDLPKGDFIWLDRGCICNLAHIAKVSGNSVILTTGKDLQVSRDRMTEIKGMIRSYWLDERGK